MLKGRVRIDLVYIGEEAGEAPKRIDLQADPSLNVVDREAVISRLADTESSEEEDDEGEQVWVKRKQLGFCLLERILKVVALLKIGDLQIFSTPNYVFQIFNLHFLN